MTGLRQPIRGVEIIDAHAHLGPYSRFFIPASDADGMVAVMDRTGVAAAVLSANLAIQSDARAGNDLTAAAVKQYPDRLAGYLVANPWQQPEQELRRLVADPRFVGIKVHPSLHQYPVDGARYQPVWELADELGCPVLTHTDAESGFDHPDRLGRVAARFPGAVILLGHAGITPAGVDASIAVARDHPGIRLEICGSQLTGELLVDMVTELGAHRVLFGSDFPFIDQRFSLGRVLYAELTSTDRAIVLGGAARTVFSWRGLPSGVPGYERSHR